MDARAIPALTGYPFNDFGNTSVIAGKDVVHGSASDAKGNSTTSTIYYQPAICAAPCPGLSQFHSIRRWLCLRSESREQVAGSIWKSRARVDATVVKLPAVVAATFSAA